MLEIKKTEINNLDDVLKIYEHAREEMRKNGNPHQWKNSHPLTQDIIFDINHGNSYIIYDENGIYGVFSLFLEPDETYGYIEGSWLNDEEYATIHKIASNNLKKGILEIAVNFALSKKSNVRIDTHEDNKIMHYLLKKLGFQKRGIIYLKNGESRIAYQKVKI